MSEFRQRLPVVGVAALLSLLFTTPALAQSTTPSRFDFMAGGIVGKAQSTEHGDVFGGTVGAGYRVSSVFVPTLRADVWSFRGQPEMLGAVQIGARFDLRPFPNLVISPALGFGPGLANVSGGVQFVPFGRVELQAGLTLFKRARLFGAAGFARTSVGFVDRLPRELMAYRYVMVGFTLDPWARLGPYPDSGN